MLESDNSADNEPAKNTDENTSRESDNSAENSADAGAKQVARPFNNHVAYFGTFVELDGYFGADELRDITNKMEGEKMDEKIDTNNATETLTLPPLRDPADLVMEEIAAIKATILAHVNRGDIAAAFEHLFAWFEGKAKGL